MKPFIPLALLSLLATALPVRAATYNFYFNNTEQGNNSTANPSLVVKDGTEVQKETPKENTGDTKDEKSQPDKPLPQPSTPTESLPAVESRATLPPHSAWADRIRLVAAVTGENVKQNKPVDFFDADPYSSTPFWKQTTHSSRETVGFMISGTYLFSSYFGATLNLGTLSGLEGEVSPFGAASFFQPALMAGWMVNGMELKSPGAPYIGARMLLNFSQKMGLSLASRISIADNDNGLDFKQIEAGLSFRI